MHCPKCRSTVRTKNGKVKGKQRYKCKDCGCNYTKSTLSRTAVKKRAECIRIYLEGVGFRGVSRLTDVPHTTVMRWVHSLGNDIERLRPKVEAGETISTLEIDELWHFVRKKRTNAGSG